MRNFALAALLGLAALPAAADKPRLPPNPAYKAECGSCHVPYPPKLLPAQSWRALMARLDRHFGSDASLDARTSEEISRYLATESPREEFTAHVCARLHCRETAELQQRVEMTLRGLRIDVKTCAEQIELRLMRPRAAGGR